MPVPIIHTRNASAVLAPRVTVEGDIASGLPRFSIVGLPETAIKESKDRVRGAIKNSGFTFPSARITVNLAPADLPKEGARFDLAVALAVLIADGQLRTEELDRYEFLGELSLDGLLRPVRGAVAAALAARNAGKTLILAGDNAAEAALVDGIEILPARDLNAVCAHLCGMACLEPAPRLTPSPPPADHRDMSDIRGQARAKRALEIAAAGGHNLLMSGPPGAGKTMLADRLPGLLPLMSEHEALETAAAWSASDHDIDLARWRQRPFRAPHHTASAVAVVGGGTRLKPGEITLAHNGVLFLDELPEFQRSVLESLRQPLESGRVTISRSRYHTELPARIQLLAAMNPCPCGFFGDPGGRCRCTEETVQRYRNKVSGPLLDRIDLQIEVPRLDDAALFDRRPSGASSAEVAARVADCRARQHERAGKLNAALRGAEIDRCIALGAAAERLLKAAVTRLDFSARGVHRVIRVARTIADLEEAAELGEAHMAEALSYRQLSGG